MLGADQVGFHAGRWAAAFLDCCEAILGAQVSRADGAVAGPAGQVVHRGHVTEVAVHPLGVDAPALRARARADDVRAHVAAPQPGGRRPEADRQGRPDRAVQEHRARPGRLPRAARHPAGVARPGGPPGLRLPVPVGLPEYRAYTERVRQVAAEINAEFGTPDWNPLILEVKDDYPRSLAACAVADVLLVNPIRDGMNLVAQEGPVLSERGCALVLSREAGAAAILGGSALLVNPYDVSETAAALHQALAMPDEERRRRGAAVAATAAARPPARWLGDQLASLER